MTVIILIEELIQALETADHVIGSFWNLRWLVMFASSDNTIKNRKIEILDDQRQHDSKIIKQHDNVIKWKIFRRY